MAAVRARRASDAESRLFEIARGATSIERALDQVVEACLVQSVLGPPTDLASLAGRLDVLSTETRPLPIDGFTTRDSAGNFHVVLDSEMSATRQRFTLAHELGHILLERGYSGPPRESKDLEVSRLYPS